MLTVARVVKQIQAYTVCSCLPSVHQFSTHSTTMSDHIVQKLISHPYKIVAFDFDQTIVKVHTFFQGVTPNNVHNRSLHEDFADLTLFQEIVQKLQKNNVQVAVASFGYKKVIETYLRTVLPHESESIIVLSRGSCLTKSKMLKKLLTEAESNNLKISRSQVVLFDDDIKNCVSCTKAGYNSYEVDPQTGLSRQFWKKWLRSHE